MRPHLVRLAVGFTLVAVHPVRAQTRHLAGTRLDPIVAQQGYGHPRWDQGLASANDGRGRTHGALFAGVSIGSTVTAVTTGAYAALTAYFLAHVGGDDIAVTPPR